MAELFDIGHEVDLLEYDLTETDGGDLSQGTPGLAGTVGRMEALIDTTDAMWGQVDQVDPGTGHIRIRFYIDTNSLAMGNGENFTVLILYSYHAGPYHVFRINLLYDTDHYELYGRIYNDANDLDFVTFLDPLSDGVHYIETHVEQASSDIAGDGRCRIWVDGNLEYTLDDYDNYNVFDEMSAFRFGCQYLDANTSGTLYLDELKANDDGGEIGPVVASPSPSESPSSSISPSISPSSSESPSVSPSSSESPSVSPSISAVIGEVVWGHVTGVLEENVRTFSGNWEGTGAIAGAGDAEVLELETTEFEISEVVYTDECTVTLLQNHYDPTGDDVDMDYRHGATEAACEIAGWNNYTVPFVSLGYVQIRMTSTL